MFRYLLTVAALAGAAMFASLTAALPAQAAQAAMPPVAQWDIQSQPVIHPWLCIRGGGRAIPDLSSPTMKSCWGGRFHGISVY
jgi:hypothetical protein